MIIGRVIDEKKYEKEMKNVNIQLSRSKIIIRRRFWILEFRALCCGI